MLELVGIMNHSGRQKKSRELKTWNPQEHQHLRKWPREGENGNLEAKSGEFSRKEVIKEDMFVLLES